jgi:hypothetical protein
MLYNNCKCNYCGYDIYTVFTLRKKLIKLKTNKNICDDCIIYITCIKNILMKKLPIEIVDQILSY